MIQIVRLILLTVIAIHPIAVLAQWPQWRGPSRDGVAPAASAPGSWPEKLTLKWKVPVGEGYSSPVVDGGRVFVHGRTDPAETVSAFSLVSGKPLWSEQYQAPFTKNKMASEMAKGPFSTPLAANGRLYTLGVTAVLSSFHAATGRLLWRKDFSKEVDTSRLFTGTAMSPLLDSGLLIVHVGDDAKGAFRAFDPLSGAERWSLEGHGPGYASPIAVTAGGTRQFVTMTDKAVVGVAVATGQLLWQLPFPDEWHENIVTPVLAGGVLVISGTRKGTFGYRIENAGGRWAAREVWHNPDLAMYMSSPVADGSLLYGFSNRRKGQLFCLDAATGQVKWATEGRTAQHASIVSAGAYLLVTTSDGELVVAKRSPEKFEAVRRYKVADGQVLAHPAIAGRHVIVRDATSIVVWSL